MSSHASFDPPDSGAGDDGKTYVYNASEDLWELVALSAQFGTVDDKAITTAKLDDAAVTEVKIADGAVTTAKLASSAVTAASIADGSITEAKLADGAVTIRKIHADGTPDPTTFLSGDARWVTPRVPIEVPIGDAPPLYPTSGNLWFDGSTGETFIRHGAQWVEIGGVTSGSVDPAAFAGLVDTVTAKQPLLLPVRSIFADASLAPLVDGLVLVDASVATVTLSLVAPVGAQRNHFLVQKTDATGNQVVLDPVGVTTINGAVSFALTAQDSAALIVYDSVSVSWRALRFAV